LPPLCKREIWALKWIFFRNGRARQEKLLERERPPSSAPHSVLYSQHSAPAKFNYINKLF